MMTPYHLLAGLLVCAAVTGCASQSERYFVEGCKKGGAPSSLCSCVYSEMEDKYGERQFNENFYSDRTHAFQKALETTANHCAE
jgi:hypothetical protein